MPIPILNVQQPAQLSLSDSMRKWGDVRDSQINRDEALGDIGRQQKVRDYYGGLNGAQPNVSAVSAIDPKAGLGAATMNHLSSQMGAEQVKATKAVATHFWHSLDATAKQLGVQAGTPEFQQLANKVYRATPILAQTMKNVAGISDDPNKDIDWQSAKSMADPTPEEKAQQEIQQATMKEQALYPYKLDYARAQAGIDMAKQDHISPLEQEKLELQKTASNRANAAAERTAQAAEATAKFNGKSSEDERKASSWLNQARFAFKNMTEAAKEGDGVDQPGLAEALSPDMLKGGVRSASRQKYVQAASSFSEAALRAATGAGITKDEAKQKIEELTPTFWDKESVKEQKYQALLVYLDSLEQRAGRSLTPNKYPVTPKETFKTHPGKKPGFRTKFDPKTQVYFFIPEGG